MPTILNQPVVETLGTVLDDAIVEGFAATGSTRLHPRPRWLTV